MTLHDIYIRTHTCMDDAFAFNEEYNSSLRFILSVRSVRFGIEHNAPARWCDEAVVHVTSYVTLQSLRIWTCIFCEYSWAARLYMDMFYLLIFYCILTFYQNSLYYILVFIITFSRKIIELICFASNSIRVFWEKEHTKVLMERMIS